jgi:hypothetical protein
VCLEALLTWRRECATARAQIAQLLAMGFERDKAVDALMESNGNLEAAVEWLFAMMAWAWWNLMLLAGSWTKHHANQARSVGQEWEQRRFPAG